MNDLVEAIDEELAVLKQVRGLLTGNSAGPKPARPAGKKRHMSAAARASIAAAQKRRWAIWKKNKAAK
ncbi:MAG TPA: hypothetical protein VGG72_21510 [Bryobacteraceae bacterium]|jgi:hypothetical protein